MYKLLKYEFLNSYKQILTFSIFLLLGFSLEFFINSVADEALSISYSTSFVVFIAYIAFNIYKINGNFENKQDILSFLIPEEKSKIFISKILTIIFHALLLVLIDIILKMIFHSVPLIGLINTSKIAASLNTTEKLKISIFYFLISSTLIIQLILSGMLIVLISNTFLKNNIYRFLISITFLITFFFINITLMMSFIYKFPCNYTIHFDTNKIEGVTSQLKYYAFFSYKNSSFFIECYSKIIMNLTAPLFCFIWTIVIAKITQILFSNKLEL